MKILGVEANKIVNVKTTGYADTGSLFLATVSGVTKNKTLRKTHKSFAYLTAFLTALHIGLVEYYKKKWSKNKVL